MSEYKCGTQVAKVFLQWLYDQGCRPNVFPTTHPKSKKHNQEKYVFYWPPRCAKFVKVTILNKELYRINEQQPYIDCFQYGA
jgi:hypothetical protein